MNNFKKKKPKCKKKVNDNIELIKPLIENNAISTKEITTLSEISYPLFSFKYLHDNSYTKCEDAAFLMNFLKRLQKLSELGWASIRTSHKHSYGMEKIPIDQLNAQLTNIPSFITPEIKQLDVFRSSGDNKTFVGFQESKIFHIFFIEAEFGDICKH